MTGKTFDILPAPPKEVLSMFGGSKSIEEFRKIKENEYEIKINYYPFIYLPQQIETKEISKLIDESVSNIKKNKETKISIKRTVNSKKTKEISLENLLGIKVQE
jgi:hypothetical protein